MARKSKQNNKGLFNKFLVRIAAVAVVVGSVVLIYATERDCAEKEQEMESIQVKIDAYEVENADLQRILDSDDIADYIARVALEERGYAYPDERRFYDTSRD